MIREITATVYRERDDTVKHHILVIYTTIILQRDVTLVNRNTCSNTPLAVCNVINYVTFFNAVYDIRMGYGVVMVCVQ